MTAVFRALALKNTTGKEAEALRDLIRADTEAKIASSRRNCLKKHLLDSCREHHDDQEAERHIVTARNGQGWDQIEAGTDQNTM